MLSFHNKQAVKNKYIARVHAHREADRLIKGIGWENGKGCAVGCTLKAYDHARYPLELGLPEWLARLEDAIFENLPNGAALEWPERFLTAIPVGVDVEPVKHALAIRRIDWMISFLEAALGGQEADVIEMMRAVQRCHEAEQMGTPCDWSTARSAAWNAENLAAGAIGSVQNPVARTAWGAVVSATVSAAWSATASADSVVESAAASVESVVASAETVVTRALWSAAANAAASVDGGVQPAAVRVEGVVESADNTVESVVSAVRSTAASAAWQKEADTLIELLSALKT